MAMSFPTPRRLGYRLNLVGMISAAVALTWAVIAVIAPWLTPYGPGEVVDFDYFGPISPQFWLGSDYLGRDMLSRILVGTRYTVGISLAAVLIACFTGVVLGMTARVTLSALAVAGSVIAQQLGLGFVTTIDPTQGQQGALIGNFLTILALTLLFATDMHHLVIAALSESGGPVMDIIDYSEHAIGQGSTVQAAAYVECRTADGKSLFGCGLDTDVATASVRAILSAANGA